MEIRGSCLCLRSFQTLWRDHSSVRLPLLAFSLWGRCVYRQIVMSSVTIDFGHDAVGRHLGRFRHAVAFLFLAVGFHALALFCRSVLLAPLLGFTLISLHLLSRMALSGPLFLEWSLPRAGNLAVGAQSGFGEALLERQVLIFEEWLIVVGM